MKYTVDCEFNGFGGELLSIALVREDNEALYLVFNDCLAEYEPWVKENVVPYLWSIPSPIPGMAYDVSYSRGQQLLGEYLRQDPGIPYVIADWPEDICHLSSMLLTGPGQMLSVPRIQFDIVRVDSWPNTIPNAVQHNAYWDAVALKVRLGI